jgi:hypothetical protein
MVAVMRIFFTIYSAVLALRFIGAVYFFFLSVTTAPEDTSELFAEGREMMEWLNNNLVLDLTLLVIGLAGLCLAFGWGNWKLAIHRYFARQKLERLSTEAKRVSEDIANTISQERARRDAGMALDFERKTQGGQFLRDTFSQDQRYLAKHMMESASIIRRLDEVGYWRPSEFHHEIGIAGATGFAAEATCKELYTASDRIASDLKDGIISLLSQPQLPEETAKGKRR